MSYETRINCLAEELREEAFNELYDAARDRLLNTYDGYQDLVAATNLRYPEARELRAIRDRGGPDASNAVLRLRRLSQHTLHVEACHQANEALSGNEDY